MKIKNTNFRKFFSLAQNNEKPTKMRKKNNIPLNCGFIYLIENSFNDKVYIDQTSINVKKRWSSHKTEARNTNENTKNDSILYRAILEGIEPEQLPNVKIYNAYDYKEPKALVKPNTTKEWEIHFPDGRKEIHKGLIEFAKEYNLTHTSLRKVADGKEHIIKVLNVL